MTDLSTFTGKPNSPDICDEIAKGARDACLTIFRMELDEVYQKARKESRLDAMVDLTKVLSRVPSFPFIEFIDCPAGHYGSYWLSALQREFAD